MVGVNNNDFIDGSISADSPPIDGNSVNGVRRAGNKRTADDVCDSENDILSSSSQSGENDLSPISEKRRRPLEQLNKPNTSKGATANGPISPSLNNEIQIENRVRTEDRERFLGGDQTAIMKPDSTSTSWATSEAGPSDGHMPSLALFSLTNSLTSATSRSHALCICGLDNLGNTCFLNSVLQALRYTPGFVQRLKDLQRSEIEFIAEEAERSTEDMAEDFQAYCQLTDAMVALFDEMEEKENSQNQSSPGADIFVRPWEFLEKLRQINNIFEGFHQHDAHELLNVLLNSLEMLDDLIAKDKRKSRSNKSELKLVKVLFEGKQLISTKCSECNVGGSREESFTNISVSITKPVVKPGDKDGNGDISDGEDEVSTISSSSEIASDWLVNACRHEEMLKDDNKYYCDHCRRYNEALLVTEYETLPMVLVFHLKRFKADFNTRMSKKLTRFRPTPLTLPCMLKSCHYECQIPSHKYQLYAVIIHQGSSMEYGHYYSYVRVRNEILLAKHRRFLVGETGNGETLPTSTSQLSQSEAAASAPDAESCAESSSNFDLNSTNPVTNTPLQAFSNGTGSCWLKCDDSTITIFSEDQLVDALKSSIATPYLLFYSKME